MLPCPGYYKQCCDEHWGTLFSFNSGFLGVYAQQWDCWVIWQKNPRVSRRKEILKIRAEIKAKETKETIAKINKAKSWFFERINKIDKPLARLIKKQRERNQINKIRIENGDIIIDNTEMQRIIRDYYQQLTKEETRIERDTCTPMFITALFIIARKWKQPGCPSADDG